MHKRYDGNYDFSTLFMSLNNIVHIYALEKAIGKPINEDYYYSTIDMLYQEMDINELKELSELYPLSFTAKKEPHKDTTLPMTDSIFNLYQVTDIKKVYVFIGPIEVEVPADKFDDNQPRNIKYTIPLGEFFLKDILTTIFKYEL